MSGGHPYDAGRRAEPETGPLTPSGVSSANAMTDGDGTAGDAPQSRYRREMQAASTPAEKRAAQFREAYRRVRAKRGDCRSQEGVMVGLIDGMIAQARVVAQHVRLYGYERDLGEALLDLRGDADLDFLMRSLDER